LNKSVCFISTIEGHIEKPGECPVFFLKANKIPEISGPLDMKWYLVFRRLSLVCYLFIFIKGYMIPVPFILVLFFGIGDAYPNLRPFLVLADLGLILLVILAFTKRTILTMVLDGLVYLMLVSPLIWMSTMFPIDMLKFPLCIVPFAGFVLLYPLSVLLFWLTKRSR
jgi:hypothetical protein